MKNKKLFKVALIALLVVGSQVLFGFKPVNSKSAYKLKSVHMTRLNARLVQYDFYFANSGGYSVTLSGRGTLGSGNVNTFIVEYFGPNPDSAVASGTASGTYTINSTGCTINVSFQASGHTLEGYSGVADYSVI